MGGLTEIYDPRMLYMVTFSNHSWELVEEIYIARCWIMENVLPADKTDELAAQIGSIKNISTSTAAMKMTERNGSMSLQCDCRDPFHAQFI